MNEEGVVAMIKEQGMKVVMRGKEDDDCDT